MNKIKKIAFLDFDDIKNPLLNGGQARATYEVGRRLCKRGYKVTVYCSSYPGSIDRIENGIEYKHISFGSKHIRLNNIFYILTIPFHIRKIEADIIIESFVAPISTLCSPLFTKIPVIALPSMFNAKAFTKKYILPFHWFERFGSRFYKYFVPYSEVDLNKMLEMNPSVDYRIIPQGVDEKYFKITHKKPKYILYLSRLDIEQKGIDLLLKSYSLVAKKLKYPLVIAGHGPDQKKVNRLIKDLNLEEKVKLVGPVYGSNKYKLISEAVFVAFPSRHDELSLWALEAFASGLPIVAFNLPESSWMGNKACLKAKPFDLEEYAKLLIKASKNPLNKKMRIEARKVARNYKWGKVASQFDKFIREILKKESLK